MAARTRLQIAAGLALLALAGGLWLSTHAQSRGATATQTQAVSATVNSAISWGSVGTCVQSLGAAAFGSVSPGGTANAPGVGVYTGCISSNAVWNVTGTMTTPPSKTGGGTIPAGAFRLESVTEPTLAGTPACPAANTKSECTLNNAAVSFVSKAPATPAVGTPLTNGFTFRYQLAVPESQPSGTYENGLITLTASTE